MASAGEPPQWAITRAMASDADFGTATHGTRSVGDERRHNAGGLFDIDLEGHRRDDDNNRGGTVAPAVLSYRLIAWSSVTGSAEETPLGECRDIAGLFHERPRVWPPGPPVTLLGCRPGLSGSFDAELAHVRVDGT